MLWRLAVWLEKRIMCDTNTEGQRQRTTREAREEMALSCLRVNPRDAAPEETTVFAAKRLPATHPLERERDARVAEAK